MKINAIKPYDYLFSVPLPEIKFKQLYLNIFFSLIFSCKFNDKSCKAVISE